MDQAFSVEVGSHNFQDVVLEGSKKVPVIVDFWAPWCGPCRALKPVLEKLAAEYGGRFTLAKVNSDENQEIAASFGVRSIPAVKAVVDGKLVDEFVGALPEGQVRAFIDRVLPSAADIERKRADALLAEGRIEEAVGLLEEVLAAQPKDAEAAIALTTVLLEQGRIVEARAAFDRMPVMASDDARVRALKARIEFAGDGTADAGALEARISADPADLDAKLQFARLLVQRQDYERALEQLLEIVRADRKFGNDAGRRTMIEVFDLLGSGHELVSRYRRALASALY